MTSDSCESPIRPGFEYEIVVEFDLPILRMDAVFVAHVRERISATTMLFSLSSEDGEIEPVDSSKLVVRISEEKTALLSPHSVWVDFVERAATDNYLGGPFEIPVRLTVTRGLS